MQNREEIEKLREAVRSASAPDRSLDAKLVALAFGSEGYECQGGIWRHRHDEIVRLVPEYTSSIDAAIALCERTLPRR